MRKINKQESEEDFDTFMRENEVEDEIRNNIRKGKIF